MTIEKNLSDENKPKVRSYAGNALFLTVIKVFFEWGA